MTCGKNQLDLLSAARRHVADAERLEAPSLDQAWHLAGFGPECARKALIFDPGLSAAVLQKVIGHDFSGDADEELLDWVVRLDPWAHRYTRIGWSEQHNVLKTWSPQHRYEPTGESARLGRDVAGLLGAARGLVDQTTAALWMDGQLPSDWSPSR